MFRDDEDDEYANTPVLAPPTDANTSAPMGIAAPQQGPPAAPDPAPMKPIVKDYLMNNYNFGDHAKAALASIGAGFLGQNAAAAGSNSLKASKESEAQDPNSDASKRFRATLKANFPEIAAKYGPAFDNLSADDQKSVFQVTETKAKIDAVNAQKEMANQLRRDALESKIEGKRDAASKKSDDAYDKYVNGVERQASTLRGDDAAKLSSAKLSAIASGRAMLDRFKGREDEMTPNDLALLAADRVKAVTGGVPTNEEIKHMMPSNWGTGVSSVKSFFTGSPEPAHSAGWVKQSVDDFDAQEKAARDILKNRQDQITSNPKLHPDDKARISKMAVPPEFESSTGGQSFSQDVMAYAQEHNITPAQAQAIKNKRTGGQ